jgi:hypothetical protein
MTADLTTDAYAALCRQVCEARPEVRIGTSARRRGFGSGALTTRGQMAAFPCDRRLAVKLPAARVDALVAANAGERLTVGRGRPMREWLLVAAHAEARWAALTHEALDHVSSAPPPKRRTSPQAR